MKSYAMHNFMFGQKNELNLVFKLVYLLNL